MTLTGKLINGCGRIENAESFSGIEAASGRLIDPTFSAAGPGEVDRAAISYASTDREERPRFLEQIADNIMAIGDALIERSVAESGLPRARLRGERARTVGQLRLFRFHKQPFRVRADQTSAVHHLCLSAS